MTTASEAQAIQGHASHTRSPCAAVTNTTKKEARDRVARARAGRSLL